MKTESGLLDGPIWALGGTSGFYVCIVFNRHFEDLGMSGPLSGLLVASVTLLMMADMCLVCSSCTWYVLLRGDVHSRDVSVTTIEA